jgi:predicted dehydrogenase
VPRNLLVRVPPGVSAAEASCVTLGAIALQGVRRAAPTLGESIVVVGLGVLGQLTVQILKASGCRVIASDLAEDRLAIAMDLGADATVCSGANESLGDVSRLTDGLGADAVIITAATTSDEVVSTAFQICRKKGRVVLVGDVGLHLRREDIYTKELDFLVSTSYGPGRYDRRYEDDGVDYPISYVRWTENRNMAEVLRLVANGNLSFEKLIGVTGSIDEAPEVYASLQGPGTRPLMALLRYDRGESERRRHERPRLTRRKAGVVQVAVVGLGGFAQSVHLPNVKRNERLALRAVVGHSGHGAAATASRFAADYATTDFQQVLDDPDVDAVIVTTRHDTHGAMMRRCLSAGKHVLVEKPLTLNSADLDAIRAFYADSVDRPVLLTGFNRRFSPFFALLRKAAEARPCVIAYRMNGGYVPSDNWVQGSEGGGRNLGEACHIYDFFTGLTGAQVADVQAMPIGSSTYYRPDDNFTASLRFESGALCTLTYTAMGSTAHAKEQMELFVDGRVYFLNDYRELTLAGAKHPLVETRYQDKGHRQELDAFAQAVQGRTDWPIPLWQQLQSTEIAFRVQGQISPSAE